LKESYGKGLATHTDPESCGAVCKGGVEALTGARAGRVFSRESKFLRDADAVGESGRPHRVRRYGETLLGPARSETPCTYGRTSCGSREVPCSPVAEGAAGRVGKFKDVRRR
jgi:RNA-directed DNA polymerase